MLPTRMFLLWISLLFFCITMQNVLCKLTVDATSTSSLSNPTVVIVGSGIGGTSCAYYLKKMVPNASAIILETDSRIGGRVYDVKIDGEVFVIGVYSWAGYHQYVRELVNEMGLDRTDRDFDGEPNFVSPFTFTAWNGTHLIDTREIATAHEESMDILENGTVDFYVRMEDNYALRGYETFSEMEEFLSYGALGQWPTLESRQYYTDGGVHLELQDLAMEPLQKLINSQGMEGHVFSMYTSLSMEMGRGRVVGGNLKLIDALAEATSADVFLNSTVTTVERLSDGFNVVYQRENEQREMYADYVVIAAPLEATDINFQNFDPPVSQPSRNWYASYVYVVAAEGYNKEYFTNDPGRDVPGFVVGTPGESSGLVFITSKNVADLIYYTVTTTRNFTVDIEDMFINPSIRFEHHWKFGHPVLEPQSAGGASYQDVVLSPGLYNIGVMNDVMSQMEGSVIAARNAALLIKQESLSVSCAISFIQIVPAIIIIIFTSMWIFIIDI
ncbi:prenylcysteine oxidase 1-like [Ptychodera flava]|uniref:prenylcysteine oxidase 1-like n=1 Tax=Ptychodera flava TaxID=63121 RepID=UPI003969F937